MFMDGRIDISYSKLDEIGFHNTLLYKPIPLLSDLSSLLLPKVYYHSC